MESSRPTYCGATYWSLHPKKNSHRAISLVRVDLSTVGTAGFDPGDPLNPIRYLGCFAEFG